MHGESPLDIYSTVDMRFSINPVLEPVPSWYILDAVVKSTRC